MKGFSQYFMLKRDIFLVFPGVIVFPQFFFKGIQHSAATIEIAPVIGIIQTADRYATGRSVRKAVVS